MFRDYEQLKTAGATPYPQTQGERRQIILGAGELGRIFDRRIQIRFANSS